MSPIHLHNLRVLNTRPAGQNHELSQQIRDAHGYPIECPALEIQPRALKDISLLPPSAHIQHAIFTSSNAVHHSFAFFNERHFVWAPHINVIAVGHATANALRRHHVRIDAIPTMHTSEHLLALKSLQAVDNHTILLVKGLGGRQLIQDTLTQRGAHVIILDVYERQCPHHFHTTREVWPAADRVDIIIFTSEEAMLNLFHWLGKAAQLWLRQTPCLVVSDRLQLAAARLGIEHILVCQIDTILPTLHQFSKRMSHGKKNR